MKSSAVKPSADDKAAQLMAKVVNLIIGGDNALRGGGVDMPCGDRGHGFIQMKRRRLLPVSAAVRNTYDRRRSR